MAWWEPDQMEMARLQYIIISSWDNETRRKAVDALVSYGKNMLREIQNMLRTSLLLYYFAICSEGKVKPHN